MALFKQSIKAIQTLLGIITQLTCHGSIQVIVAFFAKIILN